jgi:chaperonin GroES
MQNPSGINPTEFRVLVRPEKVEERTAGGIIIPDQTKDRDQYAVMKGTLIAMSPVAFSYAEWPEGTPLPKAGDMVLYEKYAGALVKGKDGVEYRVINDKDIHAVLD